MRHISVLLMVVVLTALIVTDARTVGAFSEQNFNQAAALTDSAIRSGMERLSWSNLPRWSVISEIRAMSRATNRMIRWLVLHRATPCQYSGAVSMKVYLGYVRNGLRWAERSLQDGDEWKTEVNLNYAIYSYNGALRHANQIRACSGYMR